MGDVIDVTSWHRCFYRITNNVLVFDVKAQANVALSLAQLPGPKSDVRISLGRFYISIGNEKSDEVYLPQLLSGNEYRSFWVSWDRSMIRVGQYGESRPIVTFEHEFPLLQYVTFLKYEQFHVSWKFRVCPSRPLSILRKLDKGEPKWIRACGQLPDDAIIGGYENEVLYIIRSKHSGSLTPGKFVPSQGLGLIPWGGEAHPKVDLEVLCGIDYAWVKCSEDKIPPGAIIAGYSEDNHETLYVGRVTYRGHIIPGKVQPTHKSCYIPVQTSELGFGSDFEILVCPNKCIPYYKNIVLARPTEVSKDLSVHFPLRDDSLVDVESENYQFGYDLDDDED